MPKKNKRGGKTLTSKNLQIEILRFLLANPRKRLSSGQILEQLQVANNSDSIQYALSQLVTAGSVNVHPGNRFGVALDKLTLGADEPDAEPAFSTEIDVPSPSRVEKAPRPAREASRQTSKNKTAHVDLRKTQKTVEGIVDMTRSGAAYILSEMLDSDVYVAARNLHGALNGDRVRIALFPQGPARGRRDAVRKPEGQVTEVLHRANEFFIGTLRKGRKYALFLPDNPNMPVDLYVPLDACGEARDGDKVVVRVTDWQEGKGHVPIATVTQTLGAVGGNDFEMKKILVNAGFELSHNEESIAEANAIPEGISPQEIQRRRDFRDVLTFTIDPEDAKDFDDALSIRELKDGQLDRKAHV